MVDEIRSSGLRGGERGVAGRALEALLRPQAIAVVGAGSDPESIAGLLFANLVAGYKGLVLPVNPRHATIQGVASYPTLSDCPAVPDLVVVCTPAATTPAVVAEAGERGVGAVCVVSAGFAETGAAGAELEARLAAEAARHGVRLLGPNCVGVLGGSGERRFNATFSRVVPATGRVAALSQSGAVGLAVLEAATWRGIGIGSFVSIGNAADLSAGDFLRHWADDPATELALLYLESIDDPLSFLDAARRASSRIPVVVLKAGRTPGGRRAAMSHTAALAGGDVALSAVLQQSGVIRAESLEELLDLASILAAPRRCRGRRVAVLTNGGGPGVLAADACEKSGLDVPALGMSTRTQLSSFLPGEASVVNPVDMISSATAAQYGQAVRVLADSGEVDNLLVVFNMPLLTPAVDVAAELVSARHEIGDQVQLVAAFTNRDGPPPQLHEAGIPAFVFAENAARALGRAVGFAERQQHPPAAVRRPQVDDHLVSGVIAAARHRSDGAGWLRADDAGALVAAYGIDTPRHLVARSPEEAAAAQRELGCAVVVKIAAPLHKSELGAVCLGVTSPEQAAAAVRAIRARLATAGLAEAGDDLLVQQQIGDGGETPAGCEMLVGVNREEGLGPLVVVGLGGSLVELLGDVAMRLAPLSDHDAAEMVASLRSYPLLRGYRGSAPLDVESLCDVVWRVGAMAAALPELVELDLNPVLVGRTRAVALDVRARLVERAQGLRNEP
jgi:acyl-CoA synthetase (NDP forming)